MSILTSEVLVAFLTGVAGPILVLVTRYILAQLKKRRDPIKESTQAGTIVLTKMEEMQHLFGVDRVWITQFHNGGHFYPTGKSIQKFSMIYELVSQYADSIRHNFQNIPINLFSRSINHLLEEDVLFIPDYKDESISTYGLKYVAEETSTKSSYLFALKTIQGRMIGVLALEFVKDAKTLTEEELTELQIHAGQIGVLLETYLYKK